MQSSSAPDPNATALMQAKLNQNTAIQQQQMNMMDQVTPDGSLNYTQNGTRTYVDAFGKTREIPVYTATQTLSDQNQAIYDSSKQAQGTMASTAATLAGNAQAAMSDPLKLGNEATEARLYELGSKRLDPQFAQAEDAMRTRLANAGIKPGSEAFDREMANFSYGRNDAYNNLLLSGRQLADQELTAERNQNLNELNALLTGSQVSQPQFVNTPQTQVAGVDYAGIVNNAYKQESANNNAMMGGLFGTAGQIGAAAVPFMLSDRRAKEAIRRVGELDNGLPVYAYRYKGSPVTQIGLMADEVETVHPEAVAVLPSGFKAVDYARAVEA